MCSMKFTCVYCGPVATDDVAAIDVTGALDEVIERDLPLANALREHLSSESHKAMVDLAAQIDYSIYAPPVAHDDGLGPWG